MIFKPRRVSSPLADSWLSLTAPTDAQKKCLLCELRQGAEPMEKAPAARPFRPFFFCAHVMFCDALSPDSVDKV